MEFALLSLFLICAGLAVFFLLVGAMIYIFDVLSDVLKHLDKKHWSIKFPAILGIVFAIFVYILAMVATFAKILEVI